MFTGAPPPHTHTNTHTLLHLCIQVRCMGAFLHPCLGTWTLVVMFPEPCPPGQLGTREEVGPSTGAAKEAGLQEMGVAEAKPCLPGFIKRAVMNPLGRSSPHAHHSRSLLVQREAFDSHRQLSDGTKSLHTPLFLLPPSLSLSAFTSLLSHPPSGSLPLPSHPLSQSMKNTTAREGPSPWLDSLMEKRGLRFSGLGQQKGEKKERFALLIEEGRRGGGGNGRKGSCGERKCKQEHALAGQRHGT